METRIYKHNCFTQLAAELLSGNVIPFKMSDNALYFASYLL